MIDPAGDHGASVGRATRRDHRSPGLQVVPCGSFGSRSRLNAGPLDAVAVTCRLCDCAWRVGTDCRHGGNAASSRPGSGPRLATLSWSCRGHRTPGCRTGWNRWVTCASTSSSTAPRIGQGDGGRHGPHSSPAGHWLSALSETGRSLAVLLRCSALLVDVRGASHC